MTDETTNESESRENETVADGNLDATEDADPGHIAVEFQAQIDKLQDQLLRGQADLENFRRRSLREADEARRFQSMPVVRDLLPALDNLDRAIQAAEQTGDVSNLLEGIRMVSQQLSGILKGHAAQPISAEGQIFDPNLHEALSQVATSDHPPMTVIQVVESGYVMHDRIVRPAKVIVSCAPPDTAPNEQPVDEQD
jgi:molecular chaperone GrpE